MNDGSLVLAIARPLLPSFPKLSDEEHAVAERELEQALQEQFAEMPSHLRIPFAVALLGFEWLPLLRYGRAYRSLPRHTQARIVGFWSAAPVGAMRNFIKLVRTCALFTWLDHPIVVARLEAETTPTSDSGGAGAG